MAVTDLYQKSDYSPRARDPWASATSENENMLSVTGGSQVAGLVDHYADLEVRFPPVSKAAKENEDLRKGQSSPRPSGGGGFLIKWIPNESIVVGVGAIIAMASFVYQIFNGAWRPELLWLSLLLALLAVARRVTR